MALTGQVWALDLNGAWAGDADNCAKVFTRKGSQFAFSADSDVYGSGFIVEGDQLIGKAGRCRVRARKDNGANINIVAACATSIMSENMQFSLREVDANTVIRTFPGMEDMEIKFSRCPAQ